MQRLCALLFTIGLFADANLASAQTKTFRDWSVVMSDDKHDLIAATSTDGDKYFAYRCFGQLDRCAHSFNLDIECEDGKAYPVLVNASSAAASISCTCSQNGEVYELIPEFEEIHSLVLKSTGYIGFAVPMASGQFKVVRFSLAGIRDAMTFAERAINADSSEYH
jgi:hypothetical protein